MSVPQSQPQLDPPFPTALSREIGNVLIDLLDELRRSTSLVDVNIAAGIALAELVQLLGHNAEQASQLIQLPFNPS